MSRMYFKEHVTVLSYDSITSMLTTLGSGTLEITTAEAENSALMDEWTDTNDTKKTATFEGEFAAETGGTNWFSEVGGTGTLTFTSSLGTVTGTFLCTKASQSQNDAMRWNVSLKSKGTVTIS